METLNIRFAVTQIRLWIAPLLPLEAAHEQLAQARQIAAEDGYKQLLAETDHLEADLALALG